MEETKFYVPQIEELRVGLECEVKATFLDGTVKTQEDYDFHKWSRLIVSTEDMPYIERALTGRNSKNGICGVRVKCLDMEDIVSLGWKPYLINVNGFFFKLGSNSDIELSFMRQNALAISNYNSDLFLGTIRNKSELKVLMKQLGIIG